jgi:hypothetical protein
VLAVSTVEEAELLLAMRRIGSVGVAPRAEGLGRTSRVGFRRSGIISSCAGASGKRGEGRLLNSTLTPFREKSCRRHASASVQKLELRPSDGQNEVFPLVLN